MSATEGPRQPYRKSWAPEGGIAPSRVSDVGHRREPLPESAAWNIISYLLAGLVGFGVPGFLLDRWLGTTWIVGVAILLGSAVAMLTIWTRYGTQASGPGAPTERPSDVPTPVPTPQAAEADRPLEEQP